MRKIKLFYVQEGRMECYESAAKTLGELVKEQDGLSLNLASKKVTVKESKENLENMDAVLPERESILFIYPRLSRAGL